MKTTALTLALASVTTMLGPSAVAATADDPDETSVSGTGGALGIAIGYAIAPNVILYGEIFDNVAISPTIENDAMETELSDDTAFGLVGIGPGIAVYLPHNFYLSSTLAFARLVVDPNTEEDDDEGTSDLGVALTAAVGKEWWVSKNWGLGLALQLYGGAMKDGAEDDDGEDVTWSAGGALLAFSATLN
jgi:opacity protein-like surface antigen